MITKRQASHLRKLIAEVEECSVGVATEYEIGSHKQAEKFAQELAALKKKLDAYLSRLTEKVRCLTTIQVLNPVARVTKIYPIAEV